MHNITISCKHVVSTLGPISLLIYPVTDDFPCIFNFPDSGYVLGLIWVRAMIMVTIRVNRPLVLNNATVNWVFTVHALV